MYNLWYKVGLVVSILMSYFDDPSLNPAGNQFSVLYCNVKMKINLKEARDGPFKKVLSPLLFPSLAGSTQFVRYLYLIYSS